jgi:hypothetical protein
MKPLYQRLGVALLALLSFQVSATTHYVDVNNASPASPYTNWVTAAANIQDAIDAGSPNDSILVTNGLYKTGTTLMGSLNRVVITKSVTVQSVNGPGVTMIVGDQMPGTTNGDKAVRCVYLSNGAVLSGFTLTNGATGTISGNYGGGVYFEVGSGGVVSNCVLVGNSAASLGGGAYLGLGALNNCTLSGNYAPNGGGAVGGALNNCTLSGNSAINGGGAYACRLNYCTVVSNSASSMGGGVYESTLSGCTLIGNTSDSGGGAYSGSLSNCVLTANSATNGGGVCYGSMQNCTLTSNSASSDGGAAWVATLNDCALTNNTALSKGGGAYWGWLTNCALTGNSAASGGGTYSGTLDRCTVAFNSAISAGGGTYSGTLTGCLIVSNQVNSTSAGQGNGGGISGGRAGNCTIVGNQAGCSGTGGGLGGGVFLGMLQNCVVFFNTAKSYPNYYGGTLTNSCTVPAALGTGNITNEPRFINLSAGDFHLQTNSPCINSGNNTCVSATTDLDGNPRIKGGTVDIGAYEFQSPASVISYAWLQRYSLPTDGTADYADTDGDGMNNWQEWIAGTSPINASSVLKVLAPSNNVSGMTVTWQSVSGVTYFIQRSSNLVAQPAFFTIRSNIAGQAGTTSWLDTTAIGPGPFFYRVGVQ